MIHSFYSLIHAYLFVRYRDFSAFDVLVIHSFQTHFANYNDKLMVHSFYSLIHEFVRFRCSLSLVSNTLCELQ